MNKKCVRKENSVLSRGDKTLSPSVKVLSKKVRVDCLESKYGNLQIPEGTLN